MAPPSDNSAAPEEHVAPEQDSIPEEQGTPGQPTTPLVWEHTGDGARRSDPSRPHPLCEKYCCKHPKIWDRLFLADMIRPVEGGPETLEKYGMQPLCGGVYRVAAGMQECGGLTPWDELPLAVRDRMAQWCPTARQLWESDFEEHPHALLQAWIWHYLDDNFLSFSPNVPESELPQATPLWHHVRGLMRAIDALRVGEPGRHSDVVRYGHRVGYHTLRRLIASLMHEGLGIEEKFFTPVDAISHLKAAIRPLMAGGEATLPDLPSDRSWRLTQDLDRCNDRVGVLDWEINEVARNAITFMTLQNAMLPAARLRFSPLGNDALWGFPVADQCMWKLGPDYIPAARPGEPVPLVQLVAVPMLAVSGWEGLEYERDTRALPPATIDVVAAWTFCGDEADRHRLPGFEKGWHDQWIREQEELLAQDREEERRKKKKEEEEAAKGKETKGGASGKKDKDDDKNDNEDDDKDDDADGDYIDDASPTTDVPGPERQKPETRSRGAKKRKQSVAGTETVDRKTRAAAKRRSSAEKAKERAIL